MKTFRIVTALLKLGLSSAMVYVLGVAALNAAGYQPNPILFMGMALFLCGALFYAYGKWTRFLGFLAVCILAFFLYWLVFLKLDVFFIKETIPSYFRWLIDYLSGQTLFEAKYGLFLGGLLYLVIGSGMILSEKSRLAQSMVLIGGTAYFGYLWFHYIESSRTAALLFLMLGLFKYGTIRYEKKVITLQNRGYSVDEGISKGFILTLLITSIICFGITSTIKPRIEPIYIEALNEQVMESFPFVVSLRNEFEESRDYGYENGYEGSGGLTKGKRFGEPIKQSDRPMLEVKTAYKKTLYLRGSVYDLYDSDGWKSILETERAYNSGEDLGKTDTGAIRTSEQVDLSIRHVGIISSTAFTPFETFRIEGAAAKIFTDNRRRIFFSKIIPKRGSYQVSAKIPVIPASKDEDGNFASIDEKNEKKEVLRYTTHQVELSKGENSSWEVLDGVETSRLPSEGVNGLKYFALPVGYSPQVKQLTQQITGTLPREGENGSLKSTLAKVTRIAEYLRTHYEYTLEPPKRPLDKDLVEYFLFQSKKGYCVHFASAMALMLRSEGIPARYVEGFVSEYGGAEKRVVRANKAHAWVEVYIDELGGWYTFESTPILPEIIPDQKELVPLASVTDEKNGESGQQTEGDKKTRVNKDPRYNRAEREAVLIEEGVAEGNQNKFIQRVQQVLFILGLGLLLMAAMLLGLRIIKNILIPYIKLKKMWKSERNGLDTFFELLCYQGVFLGVRFQKNNTIKEYGDRLVKQIKETEFKENQETVLSQINEAVGLYEKARYGGALLTIEEKEQLTELLVNLRELGKERLGKWGFFLRCIQK